MPGCLSPFPPQKRGKLAGQLGGQPLFFAGAPEEDQDRRGLAVDLHRFEGGQQVERQPAGVAPDRQP